MADKKIIVAYDPGLTRAGLVAIDVTAGLDRPQVVQVRTVASPPDKNARLKSFDDIRRNAEQVRALSNFIMFHGALLLASEVGIGAKSSQAAVGLAYPRAFLAAVTVFMPNLAYEWVTPTESRAAVVPEDEHRALKVQAKTAVYLRGARAGERKSGEQGRLLKAAVVRNVIRLHPGVLDGMNDENSQAVADAISVFYAVRGRPIVRALMGRGAGVGA